MFKPLSVAVEKTNEIIFFGDRNPHHGHNECTIVYNANLDECNILNDKQNYKSIGVKTKYHCVFKHNNNNNSNNGLIEYISFDENHIAIYNHNQQKMYKLKLINYNTNHLEDTMNELGMFIPRYADKYKFPMEGALCTSFSLNNTNCMLNVQYIY